MKELEGIEIDWTFQDRTATITPFAYKNIRDESSPENPNPRHLFIDWRETTSTPLSSTILHVLGKAISCR
jgi:hypothetical protein